MVSEPWQNQLGSRIGELLAGRLGADGRIAYDPHAKEFRIVHAGGGGAAGMPMDGIAAPTARPDDLDVAAREIARQLGTGLGDGAS